MAGCSRLHASIAFGCQFQQSAFKRIAELILRSPRYNKCTRLLFPFLFLSEPAVFPVRLLRVDERQRVLWVSGRHLSAVCLSFERAINFKALRFLFHWKLCDSLLTFSAFRRRRRARLGNRPSNLCAYNPCQNEGVCIRIQQNKEDAFRCLCLPGKQPRLIMLVIIAT